MKHSVLVTGGMGFVGGRVAQSLAACSNVTLTLGSRTSQANPYWLASTQVVAMDWRSPQSLTLACDGIDTLVHLAGMNDSDCLRDPLAALEANAVNTVRLMQAAKVVGVKRVIYFSTAHVYGPSLIGQINESTLPKGLHPYATSHRAAEDAVLAAANENMDSIVLRLSNGFGVPAHSAVNAWALLMNDLCRQAVTLRSMTLRSSGLQQRDFITLHDVVRVLDHMRHLPRARLGDGIFNVGMGQSMRVIEMVQLIQMRCTQVLGFTPKIIRLEPTVGEKSVKLDYCIDKLLNTGFTLNGNPDDEIDAILRMCHESFITAQ
ncbi:SDR family oxidoreductase [Candidatus Njordibacter sp. Uisw_039]|uniref:NAD-dependent epimerase/dehydratase family protein n=1 Tax=Candidatus Njordibacter sp. Uisw_039 TaxID=3230972 RepID=UPI003D573478